MQVMKVEAGDEKAEGPIQSSCKRFSQFQHAPVKSAASKAERPCMLETSCPQDFVTRCCYKASGVDAPENT